MAFNLMEFLFGHSPQMQQASTMNPQQQAMQGQLLSMLGDPTGQGMNYLQQILSGDESAFRDFEAPIKRQFEQEVVPGIAERFAGMGTGGAMDSSAFQQTMGRAGTELSQNLAQLRAGLKGDALSQLQNLLGTGMKQTQQNIYDPGSFGALGDLLKGAGPGLGKSGMQMFFGGGQQKPRANPVASPMARGATAGNYFLGG